MSILQIQNIVKSFGGVRAVNDCSFSVRPHTITALIGPNGAGKTTLFDVVNGFIAPERGMIFLDGEDVTRAPAWKRSRLGISRTFQLSRLFKNLSIGENLLLALRQDDDLFWRSLLKKHAKEPTHKIEDILELVGLKKPLRTPVTDLSYGEQKLFDLARALINPHSVLLLDEPVAGINPILREKLKTVMKNIKARKETMLLIEHDMDFVRAVADWVIVMDQGAVLTEGEPVAVLKDRKVLDAYLGTV